MKVWVRLKEGHKKIDINNKFPKYFYKPIMWAGMIILFIFVGVMVLKYGFGAYWLNVQCESPHGCNNPFIVCKGDFIINLPSCDFYNSIECKGLNCDKETIKEGEYIGEMPPFTIKYKNIIILGILLFTFLINHIHYKVVK